MSKYVILTMTLENDDEADDLVKRIVELEESGEIDYSPAMIRSYSSKLHGGVWPREDA